MLRDRCIAVVRLMTGDGLREEVGAEMEKAIQTAYERRDLRGLKMVSRDLNEWVNGFPDATRARYDEILRAQLGEDPRGAEAQAREVRRILDRGTIENEDEWRLLNSRAEEIWADESKRAELEKVTAMMAAFEDTLA